MKIHALRRAAGAALVGSVALSGLAALVPSPAQAATENGYVHATGAFGDREACTTATERTSPGKLALVDNGASVTQTFASQANAASTGNAADVVDMSTSNQVTATVSPFTGGPARIDVTGIANAAAVARTAGSACDAWAATDAEAGFDFTLTGPMWVTLTATTTGNGQGDGYVTIGGSADHGVSLSGAGKSTATTTAFLPAGRYSFYSDTSASASSTSTTGGQQASVSGVYSATFVPAGAGGPLRGTGKKYVSLGGRNCTTNAVTATLAKAVPKKAAKVQIRVNGWKRANLTKAKQLKRTHSLVLGSLARTAPATVSAIITLKSGKKVTVSRSYLPCA